MTANTHHIIIRDKWKCWSAVLLLLLLSACSDYEYSIYDPLSPNYIDKDAPVAEEVDLGLSVNWASWNVGATAPEEYGNYYAWGEINYKTDYSSEDYKWCNGTLNSHTKYCINRYYGTVDGKTILEPEDDVAHVEWGGDWRMPTSDEIKELCNKCSWQWTEVNGIKGQKVIGPNGNSIFLPAAGNRDATEVYYRGFYGFYWSGTLHDYNHSACGLNFYSGNRGWDNGIRYRGFSVRPVKDNKSGPVFNESAVAEVVDLGLSVKWASWNMGATKSEGYGGYYAWGETRVKDNYDWSTYKWGNGTDMSITKYCTVSDYGVVDNKTMLDPEDDVAHVKWGGAWRMPTSDEFRELYEKCSWSWTSQNGVNGYKVTGPNGNSIFLPAAGYRDGTEVGDRGSLGHYWSGTLNEGNSSSAYYLFFGNGSSYCYWYYRDYGRTVRPVTD